MTALIVVFAIGAAIEAEYAEISDPIEWTQQLVARLQEKWPALTAMVGVG